MLGEVLKISKRYSQPNLSYWRKTNRGGPFGPPLIRSRVKIMVSRANTDIRQRFFSQRCVKLWNSLPAEVVTVQDLQSFKRGLVDAIPDKLVEYV